MQGVHISSRLRVGFLVSVFVIVNLSMMATSGFAQVGRGTISGRVVDSAGAVLRAARVEVQPGGQAAVTDDRGQFVIGDEPVGEVTVPGVLFGICSVYGKGDSAGRADGARGCGDEGCDRERAGVGHSETRTGRSRGDQSHH